MNRTGLEADQLHLLIYDIKKKQEIQPGVFENYFEPAVNDFDWYDVTENKFLLNTDEWGHSKLYLYNFNEKDKEKTHIVINKNKEDVNAYDLPIILSETHFIGSYSNFSSPTVIVDITLDTSTLSIASKDLID